MLLNKQKNVQRTTLNTQYRSQIRHALLHESGGLSDVDRTKMKLPTITEQRRLPSPSRTPQALACDGNALWMGSRDLRRIYAIDPEEWTVLEEREAPGIPWAAVSMNGTLR